MIWDSIRWVIDAILWPVRKLIEGIVAVYDISLRVSRRIWQATSHYWLVLGLALILIGLFFWVCSGYLDRRTPITITYTFSGNVGRLRMARPILSTCPQPLASPWDLVAKSVMAVGAFVLFAIASPFLLLASLVGVVVYALAYVAEHWDELKPLIVVIVLGVIWVMTFLCCGWIPLPGGHQLGDIMFGTPLPTPSPTATPTPAPSPTATPMPSWLLPDQELYYVSLDVKAPPYLERGQSHVVQLEFVVSDRQMEKAVPVPLFPSPRYTVTVEIQTVNFELSPQSQHLLENRFVMVNRPVEWNWVLTPRKGGEGRQAVLWVVQIDDGKTSLHSAELPSISANIDIKSRSGLFAWVLDPGFQLSAVAGGLVSILLSYLPKKLKSRLRLASLHRQLANARANLLLIRERKSQYVMATNIPLQLIKQEQHLLESIKELEQHIKELEQPTSDR